MTDPAPRRAVRWTDAAAHRMWVHDSTHSPARWEQYFAKALCDAGIGP